MKAEKNEHIEILEEVSENGVSFVYEMGFDWFHKNLIPSLEFAENSLNDNELLADCWYVIGDIYDFIDASLKAIESYSKSIKFDSQMASAYREIANMQERIGAYSEAVENINKAIQLDPDDENSRLDLIGIEESYKLNEKPLLSDSDILWKANELIANQKFKEVIRMFENTKDVKELKILARAYGGLYENEKYIAIWQQIANSEFEEIEIEYADWFFMPDSVYESEQIWIVLKQINERIIPSIFISYESLVENYSETLSLVDQRSLISDYQILKINGNQDELNKLKEKYPLWKELSSNKC